MKAGISTMRSVISIVCGVWGPSSAKAFGRVSINSLLPARRCPFVFFLCRASKDPGSRGLIRGFSHPEGEIKNESAVGSGLFAKNCGALIRCGRWMVHGRSVISFACCASLSYSIASHFAESPGYQAGPFQCLSYLPPPVE